MAGGEGLRVASGLIALAIIHPEMWICGDVEESGFPLCPFSRFRTRTMFDSVTGIPRSPRQRPSKMNGKWMAGPGDCTA